MDKLVIIYSMRGCPHCVELKKMLEEIKIPFIDRDVNDYEEEYELYTKVVGNEYVPALMLIENPDTESKTELYAPERDYNELEDALKIIKEFYER